MQQLCTLKPHNSFLMQIKQYFLFDLAKAYNSILQKLIQLKNAIIISLTLKYIQCVNQQITILEKKIYLCKSREIC